MKLKDTDLTDCPVLSGWVLNKREPGGDVLGRQRGSEVMAGRSHESGVTVSRSQKDEKTDAPLSQRRTQNTQLL